MFEIKNLSKRYGDEFALQNVTFDIEKGMNFIVGASGSGKTTLLKIISGMELDFEGSVTYLGKDIRSFTDKEKSALYNNTFGFVWQDFHLIEEATVIDNILLPTHLTDKKDKKSAHLILKQMKLEDIAKQKVRFLSGGQKQRVAIARELMKNPQVIFCDEPTSALDAKSAKSIIDTLRTLSKRKTVIIVTHDTSLMTSADNVYEFDKGELISAPVKQEIKKQMCKSLKIPFLSTKKAFQIAKTNIGNQLGKFCISVLCLIISGTLLLATFSGTIGKSTQAEFDKLIETYGEGILDINIVGSFMSASGTDGVDGGPNGDVSQDISGLYEKYQNDDRVEFIISAQAFENIEVNLDGKNYKVEKSGSVPVLTKLISGRIPEGKEFQVVVPQKFVESIDLTPETILGKNIDFTATIFQWVNNQPIEKPVSLKAKICGVSDNTIVYDYEGKQYTYTIDDSFFFNKSAIEEVRRQAGIENESANFTIRAKTPTDLILLKDELNKSGIVPLGRFELVEDIVRLNQQTMEQSGSASTIIGVSAVLLTMTIFVMTAALRKHEYAIYKVSGYNNNHLFRISLMEIINAFLLSVILFLITSPLLNMATVSLFGTSILSVNKLFIGTLLIFAISIIAFVSSVPIIASTSMSSMLKVGNKS